MASALLGGAQMIVHSKTLAELVEIMARGKGELPITDWFFWMEAVLVSVLAIAADVCLQALQRALTPKGIRQ